MNKKLSDLELVKQLQNGKKSAFEELFKRYSTKAYHLAYRITRKEEDAEEIIQETFINVFSKINSFQGKSAFSSWLYRITFNTSLMKLRKKKKHASLPLEVNINCEEPFIVEYCSAEEHHRCEVFPIKHELRNRIEQAVNSLPEEYRSIFVLRDIDGLSNQEVSELLDLTIPAIKSRLHRARLMLQARLGNYYSDFSNETLILEGSIKLAA